MIIVIEVKDIFAVFFHFYSLSAVHSYDFYHIHFTLLLLLLLLLLYILSHSKEMGWYNPCFELSFWLDEKSKTKRRSGQEGKYLVSVAVLMASAQCVLQLAVIVVQTVVMLPSYAPYELTLKPNLTPERCGVLCIVLLIFMSWRNGLPFIRSVRYPLPSSPYCNQNMKGEACL